MNERREIAVGLIIDDGGRLLLQLRDDKPGLVGANSWGFFGGHLEPGESASDAFLREMDEELAWRPKRFEPYDIVDVDNGGWHVTSHAFAAHLDVPIEALMLGEGQAMRLFEPAALPETLVPGNRPFIASFAESEAYARMQRRWRIVTTTGLIVDDAGRFLLQHRDDKPGIVNPGKWGSFGGVLEDYETPEEGFVRELEEELAWRPRRVDFVRAVHRDDHLVYVFAARLDVPMTSLVLGEGEGFDAFPADALPGDTVPSLARLIDWFTRSERYAALRH